MQEGIRLQKYLADCGIAARRKCEEIIAQGRVAVNGNVVDTPGTRVLPGDTVTLDGQQVAWQQARQYFAFYKPSLVVTSLGDPQGRNSIADYFPAENGRLFPVGRLDFESEGLLLITDDGQWAQRITHPKFDIEKEYYIRVRGRMITQKADVLREGVIIDGKRTYPAKVEHLRMGEDISSMHVTIHEGRNRQVRKMIEAVGCQVVYLKRVRIGHIQLQDMKAGDIRPLTAEEIEGF